MLIGTRASCQIAIIDLSLVSQAAGPLSKLLQQGTKLCVANMLFKDHYNRKGSYTGEVNPNGHGKIKYKHGTEFEGKFKDRCSDEMDASMEKPKNGFSNWNSNTKKDKMEKEKRK